MRVAFLFLALMSCRSLGQSDTCTLVACEDGVNVSFRFTGRGTYVFDVLIDGAPTKCRATIPLAPNDRGSGCDRGEVFLQRSGSALPEAQQSLEGIKMPAARDAKTVTIKGTRDAVSLGDKTFTPAYTTSRPNGPDCEPECKLATTTFP